MSTMKRLEKSRAIAEKKLIILYILSHLDRGVDNVMLTKTVLEERYMDFFTMQQYLNELIEEKYIAAGGEREPSYNITVKGQELLRGMAGLLPLAEKNRVDRTISSIKKLIQDGSAVSSDYVVYDENRCVAKLKVEENGVCLMSIEIATGSKDDARKVCDKWEEKTHEIYAQIINLLSN